ncbi:MAG TPA: tripartite tricarboxylate transporter substrate binding protein [Pseudomonadales bacterium]|nr:tripartite tricarboxylate transporter substrate binding protein [Pseudomonadales bacterium]
MIVPYPAGGPSDTIARVLSGPIGKQLGVQVIVENIGGATGSIAANKVLNAKPDGTYLYQGSANEVILPPLTNSAIRFKPTQFQEIHPINVSNLVLLIKQDLPVKSVEDFVNLAKERAATAPLTYGSVGVGSLYHLVTESISKAINAPLIHAPYRGTAPAMQDLAGGQIDFTIMAFSKVMKDMEKDGRYRILAVISKEKPEILQEYPSLSDNSIFKGFEYTTGSSYFVKTGTPEHIIEKLNKAIASAVQDPNVISLLEADGRAVSKPKTPAEAEAIYLSEIKMYEEIIKTTGFKGTN